MSGRAHSDDAELSSRRISNTAHIGIISLLSTLSTLFGFLTAVYFVDSVQDSYTVNLVDNRHQRMTTRERTLHAWHESRIGVERIFR